MGKNKSKSEGGAAGAYRVGALGDLVAKSCGVDKPEFDPVLASLFANPNKNKTVKTVISTNVVDKIIPPPKKQAMTKTTNLSNRGKAGNFDDNTTGKRKFDKPLNPQIRQNQRAPAPKTSDRLPPRQNQRTKFDKPPQVRQNQRTTPAPKAKFEKKTAEIQNTIQFQPAPEPEAKLPRLSNRDAAGIRVGAKAKFQNQNDDGFENGDDANAMDQSVDDVASVDKEEEKTKKSNKNKSPGELKKSLVQLNAPKEKDPELESRTVFVGNVPKLASKKQLLKLFRKLGTVETLRLRCAAPDKPTRLKKVAMNKKELHPDSKSVAAYVRFKTREEAESVVAGSQGLILDDHHLTLDLADHSLKKDNKRGIFVGNLNMRIDDNELWSLFEDCGAIESIRVVRDAASGLGKGFGYVNFADRASVEIALKKDGTEFKARPLRISRCVKKLKKDKDSRDANRNAGGGGANNKTGIKMSARNQNQQQQQQTSRKEIKISQGKRQRKETFSGDQTAEIGKFKRSSKKPNKEDMKKARVAKQLLVKPPPLPHNHGVKIPASVQTYKDKKKELRKLNKPRWPRGDKQKKPTKS